MRYPLARFVERVVACRWWLLAVAAVTVGAAWWPATRLSYDRTIENLFAEDDPLVQSFARLKRIFGRHEIVMLVYEDPELMSPAGQQRLRATTLRVLRSPGVASVLSLATIPTLTSIGDGGQTEALRRIFERYTHGPDGRTAAVVTMLDPEDASPLSRPAVLERLGEIADDLPRGSVIGEPVLVEQSFGMLEADSRRLFTWSAGLMAVTMLLTLRSVRWVACGLAVVVFSVVTTRALVWLAGLRLSLVSTMLPAVITVVGVATVMHVAARHRAAVSAGRPPRRAVRSVLAWLLAPIAWACATDAAGFASLLVASVEPVREFGLMMVAGSLLVLPALIAIAPAFALAWRETRSQAPPASAISGRSASRVPGEAAAHGRGFLPIAALLAVAAVAAVGAARMEVETDFTKNFRADSPIVDAYEFVEQRLGGAGVWDIVLPAPRPLDAEYLSRVMQLERRLHREIPPSHLVKTLSLADAVHALAGEQADSDVAVAVVLAAMRLRMPHFYDALYNADPADPDRHYLRVMLRAPERMPAREKLATIAEVRRIARKSFPEAEVTGYYALLANLVTSLNRDQWLALSLAAAAVFAMMMVALRSASLAAAAVLVNGLPVLLVFGGLGWAGVPLNMGGAMSAAVSLGLAVDASIHFLTAYRRSRLGGASAEVAVGAARGTVGRPVVLATIALVVGLGALCTSEFVPTVHFGIIVSATMVGGMLGNLVLLPWMLVRFGSHRNGSAT